MKRKACILFCLMLVVLLSACSSDDAADQAKLDDTSTDAYDEQFISNDPIYNFYNLVELNQTKEELDEILGIVPEIDDAGMYNYIDPETGYGVFVSFDTGDAVILKSLYIPQGGQALIDLSNASVTADMVAQVTEGISFDEAVDILGSGAVELVCSKNATDENNPFYAMAWLNNDGSLAIVYFEGFKGSVDSAEFLNSVQ
ncbi:MAG: hypothetical protein PWP16_6 [Eubacteriaceae bacterium]|jgi:hypothetical protein|nr:hypothetical protein [Eubacteriaceae bacterium]MDK2935639.1 hypothetical protein [Eubacteriaceae bacterium]MDN5306643.1 hypothetical protein [Eubacteriaceae bacterium]